MSCRLLLKDNYTERKPTTYAQRTTSNPQIQQARRRFLSSEKSRKQFCKLFCKKRNATLRVPNVIAGWRKWDGMQSIDTMWPLLPSEPAFSWRCFPFPLWPRPVSALTLILSPLLLLFYRAFVVLSVAIWYSTSRHHKIIHVSHISLDIKEI